MATTTDPPGFKPPLNVPNIGELYRIYPTEAQKVFLTESFAATRRVYNTLLQENIDAYRAYLKGILAKRPSTSYKDLSARLTALKQESDYEWLNRYSAVALQQSARNLSSAFKNFYRRVKLRKGSVGFPKFKSVNDNQSATFVGKSFSIKDNKLHIANLDTLIEVNWTRDTLPDSPTTATITYTTDGQYHVSFRVKSKKRNTKGHGIVGNDPGVKTHATLHDGTETIAIENPRFYVKSQKDLKKRQRDLRNKTPGSRGHKKAKKRVAKCHKKIANQRMDHLHKLTTWLVMTYAVICIENLNVKGMVRNPKLAKHIMDASFGTMRDMIAYKVLLSTGCSLIVADMWYPSTQLCSHCGVKPSVTIKLGVSSWTCTHCGAIHERDENASRNLYNLAKEQIQLMPVKHGTIRLCPPYSQVA